MFNGLYRVVENNLKKCKHVACNGKYNIYRFEIYLSTKVITCQGYLSIKMNQTPKKSFVLAGTFLFFSENLKSCYQTTGGWPSTSTMTV